MAASNFLFGLFHTGHLTLRPCISLPLCSSQWVLCACASHWAPSYVHANGPCVSVQVYGLVTRWIPRTLRQSPGTERAQCDPGVRRSVSIPCVQRPPRVSSIEGKVPHNEVSGQWAATPSKNPPGSDPLKTRQNGLQLCCVFQIHKSLAGCFTRENDQGMAPR